MDQDGQFPDRWSRGELDSSTLLERLRDLRRGRGNCLFIRGGPGPGKTLALDKFVAAADSQSVRTIILRCRPSSIGFGANVWSAVLTWAQGTSQGGREQPRTEVAEAALGSGAQSEAVAQAVALDAAAEVTASCSERPPEPLLLALDGLHHADNVSLILLRSVALLTRELPLLVLATYFPPEILPQPARESLKQFLATVIDHAPLGANVPETRTSAAQYLGPLHLRADQNVRFAAHALGKDKDGAAALTDEETRARLDALAAREKRVLQIAAVLGPRFSRRHLAAVSDLDDAEVAETLSALGRLGLIRSSEDGNDCSFSQESLRDIAYREIAATQRAGLHRRTAKLLESLHPYDPERVAEAIACHYAQGLDESAVERAVMYASMAGRVAAQRGDFAEAERIYTMTLRAIESLGVGLDGRQCDLLIAMGEVLAQLGKYRDAQTALSRAAEYASVQGDSQRLAAAIAHMPVSNWPAVAGCACPVTQLAQAAMSELKPGALRRAVLMGRMGFEMIEQAGEHQRGERLLLDSVQLAREAKDPRSLLQVLNLFDCALRHPDKLHERLENAAEIVALASRVGDRGLLCQGTATRLRCLLELGEIVRAEAEANALSPITEGGVPVAEAGMLLFAALRAFREGRLADAEDFGGKFRVLSAAAQMPHANDFYWPAMFACFAESGRLAELEPMARDSVSRYPALGVFRALLAWLYLELGRTADARFHFNRLTLTGLASSGAQDGFLTYLAALSMVSCELRNQDRSAALYELLRPYASRTVVFRLGTAFGSVEYYLGRLAASLSRTSQAIQHLENAIEFNRKVGGRPWAAYAACDLARVLFEQGSADQRERAAGMLTEIVDDAGAIGMKRLQRIAERLRVSDSAQARFDRKINRNDKTGTAVFGDSTRAADGTGNQAPATAAGRRLGVFLREADYWTLSYADETIRVKHSRGLELIGVMLKSPGRRFHAVELCAILDGHAGDADSMPSESKPDAMLDGRARSSYRDRLRELRADIEEARNFNEVDRVGRLEEEKAFLTRELARAVGLGGLDRKMASRSERARTRVTNAIRNTLHKISQNHAELGHYLARTVKTGTFCRYDPDSATAVSWLL